MTKLKPLKIAIGGLLLAFALILTLVIVPQKANAEYQAEITINDIENELNASLKFDGSYLVNGVPLGLSSNPYDYVKNNHEFEKLVSYGISALDDLVKLLNDKNKYGSFDRYILAIAIEEITKTDLKSTDKYKWDRADTFSNNWSAFAANANNDVSSIINNKNLTNDQKWSAICKYGTLAIPALKNCKDATNKDLAEKMINMLSTSDRDSVVNIAGGKFAPPK